MSLYPEARANLSDVDRNALDLWESAAESMLPEGPNVVKNIRNESHLVGSSPGSGPFVLQALLQQIVNRFRPAAANRVFEEAAQSYLLQGRVLASKPTMVYRFRPIDRFGESVAQANGELPEWKRNPDEYATNLLENWDTLGRQKVARAILGTWDAVFVTFSKPDGSLVTDVFRFGSDIMNALGVRLQADQDVIVLRYSPIPEAPLRYPTAAEGGWSQDFVVCKPTDAHGWTRPISNPATEGWPEAVHKNRKVDLVSEQPSRYPRRY